MPTKPPPSTPLTIRSVTRADWPLIVRLFGANGACGGCWCMWPRLPKGGKLWEQSKGAKNRASFQKLVKGDEVHAVMALAEDEPVGWCCFGPRADFPRLERVKALQVKWKPETWAVVCFFIKAGWRRCGVASKLLEAATNRAFDLGAAEVHGYPVELKYAAGSVSFMWTGVPRSFERAGYTKLKRPAGVRPVFVKRRSE